MKIARTLFAKDRPAWRRWLRTYHRTRKVIWLVFYKKHCNKPGISYDAAVEEALCFGWIDSIIKRIDDRKFVREFTPRKSGSIWSEINVRRAQKMSRAKRMTRAGSALFNEAMMTSRRNRRAPVKKKKPMMPEDLRNALAKNPAALANFASFAPGYQKMYIWYILSARKPDTRKRRVNKIVELAARNIKSAML